MDKRPMIAITSSYTEGIYLRMSEEYLCAVWDAGGVGILVPSDIEKVQEYADLFDGFIFGGGGDIAPCYYGEAAAEEDLIPDDRRDRFENALFDAVFSRGKSMLGICRGMQVMNVFMGGTLHSHIDGHVQNNRTECMQRVRVRRGGVLHRIVGTDEIITNSFHHQSIKDMGQGMVLEGISEDGQIECVSLEGYPRFFLGVQFHPEIYYKKDVGAKGIFEMFIRESV